MRTAPESANARQRTWWLSVLLLMISPAMIAGESGWTAVLTLPKGSAVVVETASHHRLEGDLFTATPQDVTLAVGAAMITLGRSEVSRVYARRSLNRAVTKGLLLGGAAGVSVGFSTAKTNRGKWALMMGSGWAAVGALIGAVDRLLDRERLVYDASGAGNT